MINYYLKPTDPPTPRFYVQSKIHKAGVPIRPVVSHNGSQLYNYKAKDKKMKIATSRILPSFPTTSKIFSLNMAR